MITLNITDRTGTAQFGHAWRESTGEPRAAVYLGQSWVTFGHPGEARALAAACTAAAEAMEALPPAPGENQS